MLESAATLGMASGLLTLLPLPLAAQEPIQVSQQSVELEPVIVRAGRVAQRQEQAASPISVRDRDAIDRIQARGLDEVLQDIPGVSISGGPRRDGLMPVIRGLSDGRVVVRLDGARQNFQRNHRSQVYLDPTLLQRVEVLRGPASTLFGSGAIGGVADFRTRDVDSLLGDNEDFGGLLSSGFQSNAGEAIGALTLARRMGSTGVLASLSRGQADDFVDGDGNAEPFSGSDSLSGVFKLQQDLGPDARIQLSHFDFNDRSPSHSTADRAFDFDRQPLRSVDRRSRQRTTSLNYQWRPAKSELVDFEATIYNNDFEQRDRPLAADGSGTSSELVTTGLDVFNTSRIRFAGLTQVLTYGVEVYQDDQQGFSDGAPDRGFSDSEQESLGAFVQNNVELTPRTSVIVGLRADRITQDEQSETGKQSSRFDRLSPQITLSQAVSSDMRAYLSYAEAFRVPNLRERFIGGTHFGNNQFLPNPELRPETAHNIELGVNALWQDLARDGDALRLQFSLYQNTIDDFIEQSVRRSDNPDPALADTTRFENVTEARLRGAELSLNYDRSIGYVSVVASHLRGEDIRANEPLEGIPADMLSISGAWRYQGAAGELGGRLVAVAEQDRLPPTTDPDALGPTHGYMLVDLFLRHALMPQLQLDLRMDNVLDKTYRQAPNLIRGLGRNLKMQLIYSF